MRVVADIGVNMDLVQTIDEVRWPKDGKRRRAGKWIQTKRMSTFFDACKAAKGSILDGSMLSFDPGSGKTSNPGYAIWEKGAVVQAGIIEINSKLDPYVRIRELKDCLESLPSVDILVMEWLEGRMVRPSLWWSAGTMIANTVSTRFLQCPIPCWHAVAHASKVYTDKVSDDKVAVLIGHTCKLLAGRP